ncbi:hypothetical protein GmRootV118_37070 [Variovorax sp. V118]|uniref:hypothetical protein n=1 Tax=Variovorax sp. V118 TaxID=3065954 RepID=UPI0034E87D6F
MPRTTSEIAHDIANFAPPEDGSWRHLDSLLDELWRAGSPEQAMPEMLSVFERYPEEDGYGVMWTIVHGLESLPNYQPELLRSLARQPSELGIAMVGRILNVGTTEIGGVSLLQTLHDLANTAASSYLREEALRVASRPR